MYVATKNRNLVKNGRKHCGKRRKCWFASIFSFFHNVFKSILSQGPCKLDCVVKFKTYKPDTPGQPAWSARADLGQLFLPFLKILLVQ